MKLMKKQIENKKDDQLLYKESQILRLEDPNKIFEDNVKNEIEILNNNEIYQLGLKN